MRYTSKKHKKTANTIIITVITALLFAAAVYIRLEKKLGSIVKEAATQQTSELIYNELDSYLKENTAMGELIHISYDEGGNIVGITTDSASINKINNELGARLSKAMKRLENSRAAIPIGALSGADLLSGSGFDIDVSFHSIQNVTTKIESSFEECGINQTKHSLKLLISTNVSAVMPGKDMTVTVKDEFLLSETVIVGKIPDVYLKKI